VIAVDTNLLVAFQRTEYPHHAATFDLLRGLAEGPAAWAIPWPCVHEFIAVVTNGRIFKVPTPLSDALGCVEALMESPSVRLLSESPTYWRHLAALAARASVSGGRVHDARVAAICLDHGVRELWTIDRDFSRFGALRVRNPLAVPPGRTGQA
jgi:uncharacterized protein